MLAEDLRAITSLHESLREANCACKTSISLHEFFNTLTVLAGPLPGITSLCGMLTAVGVHIRAFAGH